MTTLLQSFIGGRWIGAQPAQALRSAINGETVAHTHAEALDFGEAVDYARRVGLPGLLALAEETGATQDDVLAAFVAGYEVVCRTGALMSPGHYNHGFHATSTVGSVGAAAACAHHTAFSFRKHRHAPHDPDPRPARLRRAQREGDVAGCHAHVESAFERRA